MLAKHSGQLVTSLLHSKKPQTQHNYLHQPSQPTHSRTSVTPRLSTRDGSSLNSLPAQGSLKYLESKTPITGYTTFSTSSRSLLTKDPSIYSPKRQNTILTPS